MAIPIRAAVITISDKGAAGLREDTSGPALADALRKMGIEVVSLDIVPDEPDRIAAALIALVDEQRLDLVMTTGGTGPAPRDQTPEATRTVIEREMPGIPEVLRAEGYKKTPRAVLSRGIAGIRGGCLIVNLPGSPRAVAEGMETLVHILPHAIQMVRGEDLEHGGHDHDHGEPHHG